MTGAAAGVARPDNGARGLSDASLKRLLAWVVGLPLLAIPVRDSTLYLDDRLLAGLTWVLCFVPAWRYLSTPRTRRPPIPFLPFIGLEFGMFYALGPVLGEVNRYGRFEMARIAPELHPSLYTTTIRLLFLGWILLLTSYWLVSKIRRPARPTAYRWSTIRLTNAALALFAVGVVFSYVTRFGTLPTALRGLFQFGAALSLISISMLVVLNVRGLLTFGPKLALYGAIGMLLLIRGGAGATEQVATLLLTVMLAVWLAGRRVSRRWLAAGMLSLAVVVAMRGLVNEHRKTLGEMTYTASFEVQAALLGDIFLRRFESRGPTGMLVDGWDAVVSRTSLLDLFSDVVRQTPDHVPYWNGRTYLSLAGAFVPRFLWPDKPSKVLGYEFGHRYGYTLETDYSTTINLPFLVEFYANFGTTGVLVGMFLVGIIYAALESLVNRPGQNILISLVGLTLLMPLIAIESDFSLIFGGIPLTGLAISIVYLFARRLHLVEQLSPSDAADRSRPAAGAAARPSLRRAV